MSLQDKIKNAEETMWPLTMGISIGEAISKLRYELNNNNKMANAYAVAIETMRKYQMMQADYEARLKADKVAMLTDIQSEFKEGLRCKGCCNNCVNACEDIPAGWFLDFIDAKINSLKESTDGME